MLISGLDPDTKAITLVTLAGPDSGGGPAYLDSPGLCRVEVKGRRAEDRFLLLVDDLFGNHAFRELLQASDWTYVERPMVGPNRKAAMDLGQVVGAIRTVLHIWGVPHSMVDPAIWKKFVLGTGHAPKEEIAAWAQRVLGLAEGLEQDYYDAAAIAYFGLKGQEK